MFTFNNISNLGELFKLLEQLDQDASEHNETDYLLKSKANAERLKESIKQAESGEDLLSFTDEDLIDLFEAQAALQEALEESHADGSLEGDTCLECSHSGCEGGYILQNLKAYMDAHARAYGDILDKHAEKAQYAAYCHDKSAPIPLPTSVSSEEEAVQYMSGKGYKNFEVYLKLGTYKTETKTELVKQ